MSCKPDTIIAMTIIDGTDSERKISVDYHTKRLGKIGKIAIIVDFPSSRHTYMFAKRGTINKNDIKTMEKLLNSETDYMFKFPTITFLKTKNFIISEADLAIV